MRALFLVSILLVPDVASGAMASAGPTFGWDDTNFVTLNPLVDQTAQFLLNSSWLDQALGQGLDRNGNLIDEPDFLNQNKWAFQFANDTTVIFKDNFKSIVYAPWVVQDPGVATPAGKVTNGDRGDVGGADFSFVYTPARGDVGFGSLGDVHLLQIIRTTSIFRDDLGGPIRTETRYFTDNLGSGTTPFADQVGANAQLPKVPL